MIRGTWFPAQTSACFDAELELRDKEFELQVESVIRDCGSSSELNVSDRVGNIPRRIMLPDGSLFESNDNDSIDSWLSKSAQRRSARSILYTIESKWHWIMMALFTTLFITFSAIQWGLPWASKEIAHALPESSNRMLASGTLALLDKSFFQPTLLSENRQQEIRKHFQTTLVPLQDGELEFKLNFRRMPGNMANAFALPSGEIVLTDRLIELAVNQEELDSVLLHEMGHVEHRHTLRQVIQSSIISVIVVTFTGDVANLDMLSTGVASLFIDSHYSRSFETEADKYAFEHMLKAGMDPMHFGRIMKKMDEDGQVNHSAVNGEEGSLFLEYLSSHPQTEERVIQANYYSQQFKNKRSGE